MQNHNKKDMILDAMQELMGSANVQAISVSDIAQKAGIGKGSIYYYFSSKNDIIDAVIERNYSRVLDEGRSWPPPPTWMHFRNWKSYTMPVWTPPWN